MIYSVVAGVGLTIAFSVAIYGAARAVELRRDERGLAAAAAAGLMTFGLLVCTAALALGLVVMSSK